MGRQARVNIANARIVVADSVPLKGHSRSISFGTISCTFETRSCRSARHNSSCTQPAGHCTLCMGWAPKSVQLVRARLRRSARRILPMRRAMSWRGPRRRACPLLLDQAGHWWHRPPPAVSAATHFSPSSVSAMLNRSASFCRAAWREWRFPEPIELPRHRRVGYRRQRPCAGACSRMDQGISFRPG